MHTLRAATKYGMILKGHSVPSWKIFYYLYIELIFFFLSITKKNYKSEDTYCEISQRPEPAQYHIHRFILLGKPVLWLLCKLPVTVLCSFGKMQSISQTAWVLWLFWLWVSRSELRLRWYVESALGRCNAVCHIDSSQNFLEKHLQTQLRSSLKK